MPGYRNSAVKLGDVFDFGNDEDDDDAFRQLPGASVSEKSVGDSSILHHVTPPSPMLQPATTNHSETNDIAGKFTTSHSTMVGWSTNSAADLDETATPIIKFDEHEGLDEAEDSEASDTAIRVRGDGHAKAKNRKISADLDAIDSMIWNLKNDNHTNEYIAQELIKHTLVNYDAKTVGSRYVRIKRKIEDREFQRLEDELTDWHDEEDRALLRADALAQNEIEDIIERTKLRRFQIMSNNLQKILKKDVKYCAKACEKRFVELMDETASIPIELDDNPEQRKRDKAQRVIEKMEEKMVKEAREKTLKEAKAVEAHERSLRNTAEKARRAKERAEKALADAAKHEAKAVQVRNEHDANAKKRARDERRAISAVTIYAQKQNIDYTAPSPHAPLQGATPGTSKRKRTVVIDPDIADSPRNHMTVRELSQALSLRGQTKSGTKSDLIRRLEASDHAMSTKDLKDKLEAEQLNTGGSRSELIARLVSFEVGKSAWGRENIAAAPSKERSVSANVEYVAKRVKLASDATNDDNSDKDEADGVIREQSVDSGVGDGTES